MSVTIGNVDIEFGHFPIDINAQGEGPETDPELIVATICWSCIPNTSWPCESFKREVHAHAAA